MAVPTDRRSFVREVVGLAAGLWAIARAVSEVSELPPDPPLDQQLEARFTALEHGQPKNPARVEWSFDCGSWQRVESVDSAHLAAESSAREILLNTHLAVGEYFIRAVQLNPVSAGVVVWVMRCRDGEVRAWEAKAFTDAHLADVAYRPRLG